MMAQTVQNTNELIRKQLHITDTYQLQATTGTFLINGEKDLSQIYKISLLEELTKSIRIAPAYQTRVRDGIYRPGKYTFQNPRPHRHTVKNKRNNIRHSQQNHLD